MRIETDVIRNNDGILERIVIEIHTAIYPYRHTVRKVYGEAINVAKRTEEYKAIKRHLGDDWVSDITDSWYLPGNFTYKQMDKINKALSE